MRLFTAVIPPPEALEELARAVRELTPAVDSSAGDGEPAAAAPDALRWTGPGDRHVTLAFLGEVDDALSDGLTERLGRAALRHPPPRLYLAGGGRFGDTVLWTRVGGDTEALSRLAASVTAAARRCGIPVEERRYRPHLTLARHRGTGTLRPYADALAGFTGGTWSADHVHLIRSHPPAPGVPGARPRYETLRSWRLGR